jgi:signal peptidase II
VSARVGTRTALVAGAALAVLVVDQATKALVQATMAVGESIPVLPVFSITYVRNPGAAFGILRGLPASIRLPSLLIVTALAIVVLLQLARETSSTQRGTLLAVGAVLGGAAGNLVCRLRYGEVIDFLHLHWGAWYWPMFNVADSAITIGVIVIAISSLRGDRGARTPR